MQAPPRVLKATPGFKILIAEKDDSAFNLKPFHFLKAAAACNHYIKVPIMIFITKTDMCSEHLLKKTVDAARRRSRVTTSG